MTYAVRSADLAEPERLETLPDDLDTVAPLTIFRIRCETFALLVAAGELDLHPAVDLLRDEADANRFSTDEAQAVMNQAFRPAARSRPILQQPDIWPPPNWSEYGPKTIRRRNRNREREAPETTIDALKYAYAHAQQQGNARVFEEPANKERIGRLSARQRQELAKWIEARHE